MKFTNKKFLTLMCFIIAFSSCCEEQNSEKPKEAISYERAAVLQKEYIKTRATFLNEILNNNGHFKKDENLVEDVRDVSFNLETLKQYIAYVEKEAKKKKLKNISLRVYFGAYPKNDTEVKTPGFSTVFFMPTYNKGQKNKNTNNFFYQSDDDEVIEDVDGLNAGHQGIPPNNLE
ncbi:MAG: hypothetical protein AB8B78_06080 [Polaribacter sp.]